MLHENQRAQLSTAALFLFIQIVDGLSDGFADASSGVFDVAYDAVRSALVSEILVAGEIADALFDCSSEGADFAFGLFLCTPGEGFASGIGESVV